jgi:hypothetical protein
MATAVEPPQTAPDEPQEPPQETAAAGRSREDLFEYSRWLHVGEGALTCEHNSEVEEHGRSVVRASGACTDPDHFHAWIRLPNQFQVRDIVEKARAAMARKKRLLRDRDSDAATILEADLDDLRDPALRPVLVEEILDQTAHEVYAEATRTVEDLDDEGADPDDDGKLPKLYADINQDREEYARQQELAEDERNAEEYAALTQRLADYSRAVNEEIDRLQKPRREALEAKTTEAIIEIIRRGRIDQIGTEEYLHTFNAWQWYVCTFKPTLRGVPRERLFSDISVFKHQTPPRVIAVLSQSFGELEANMARGRGLGN